MNNEENIFRIRLCAATKDIEKIKQDYIKSTTERLLKQDNANSSIDEEIIKHFCKLYIDKRIKFYPTIDIEQIISIAKDGENTV